MSQKSYDVYDGRALDTHTKSLNNIRFIIWNVKRIDKGVDWRRGGAGRFGRDSFLCTWRDATGDLIACSLWRHCRL